MKLNIRGDEMWLYMYKVKWSSYFHRASQNHPKHWKVSAKEQIKFEEHAHCFLWLFRLGAISVHFYRLNTESRILCQLFYGIYEEQCESNHWNFSGNTACFFKTRVQARAHARAHARTQTNVHARTHTHTRVNAHTLTLYSLFRSFLWACKAILQPWLLSSRLLPVPRIWSQF